MSTAYPKHVFTEEEFSQTLLELNLAPAAAIIILPVNNTRWHFERSSKGRGPGGGCWGREAQFSAYESRYIAACSRADTDNQPQSDLPLIPNIT